MQKNMQQYAGFPDIDVFCQEYAKYAKKYAKYAKYVKPISICKICTALFADDHDLAQILNLLAPEPEVTSHYKLLVLV